MYCVLYLFFFCKQKTAYEMRISDWSSDVCSSDLREPFAHRMIRLWSTGLLRIFGLRPRRIGKPLRDPVLFVANHTSWIDITMQIGRATCRERVCQYV